MKKLFYCVSVLGLSIFLIQCTAKKAVATKVPAEVKSPLLSMAQKRWPAITQHDLDSGQNIYRTKCTQCHGVMSITDRTEAQWQTVINKMAPKAKLNPEQTEILTRYLFAARELGVK